MLSNGEVLGSDQVELHLAALDAAVEGLLTESLTGLSEADVVETLQRMEASLRKASAVGHRLVVESVERSIPGNLACRSINDFLISTLRISRTDAARRVKGATAVGSGTPSGERIRTRRCPRRRPHSGTAPSAQNTSRPSPES